MPCGSGHCITQLSLAQLSSNHHTIVLGHYKAWPIVSHHKVSLPFSKEQKVSDREEEQAEDMEAQNA